MTMCMRVFCNSDSAVHCLTHAFASSGLQIQILVSIPNSEGCASSVPFIAALCIDLEGRHVPSVTDYVASVVPRVTSVTRSVTSVTCSVTCVPLRRPELRLGLQSSSGTAARAPGTPVADSAVEPRVHRHGTRRRWRRPGGDLGSLAPGGRRNGLLERRL